MSSAKQRTTLTNLTEPQQLRELNRQLTWIWDQLLGGLSMKSLSGDAKAVIDSKASGEIVDELGNVVGQHSTRLLQTDEKIQTLAESVTAIDGTVKKQATSITQNAESIQSVAESVVSVNGVVSGHTTAIEQNAEAIKAVAESSGGETVLKEMEDGSVQLASAYKYVGAYTLEALGAAVGESVTWAVYVTPDIQKHIGLNINCVGNGADLYGESALTGAGEERLLSFTVTIPEGTTRLNLYFHDKDSDTTGTAAVIAYRDSVLKKGGYVSRSEFRQTAEEISLKVDGKLDADAAAKRVDTKAGVVINEDGVSMYGANIEMETSDGEGFARLSSTGFSASSIQAPDVAPRYSGPTAMYIDPGAAKEGEVEGADGETRHYYRSLADAASRLSGRAVNDDVTIWLQAGTQEYARPELKGVFGAGTVTLRGSYGDGANYRLNGCLNIHQCAVSVNIYDLDVVSPDNAAIEIAACQYVSLTDCSLTRENAPLLVTNGSKAKVNGTVLNGSSRAAMVNGDAQAFFLNTSGNGQLVVFGGGIMLAAGTTPSGGAGALANGVFGGGLYVDAGVTGGETADAPQVEVMETADILATATDSYASSGGWEEFDDNDVRQGWSTGSGKIFGCMWFDVSALAGKTVKQASLRLCKVRDDLGGTGRGTTVSVHLYGTVLASAEGSMNENGLYDYGEIGTVEPGAPNIITIPAKAAQDLIDGTIRGLVLYCMDEDGEYKKGKGYSRNYMRFYGETSGDGSNKPMLTVTYA